MADTVQQFLHAQLDSDLPALLFEDRSWTWRELLGESAARAHVLHELAAGAEPLHIGVLFENTAEMVMALVAGALGGHVTAGINTTRRGDGLAQDVRTAHCKVLLTDTEHLELLTGLDLGGAIVVNTDDDAWLSRVAAAPRTLDGFRTVETMDTFMLIFTSGTSGDPKAVQVSNFMVVMSGAVLSEKYALSTDDVCYISMPLFHSNAIMGGLAPALASGATVALARKFSASRFLDDIRGFGATYMNYVGKPLAYLLATPEKPDDADNPLRTAFGNEASDRDIAAFGKRFGCEVWDGFGSTETAVIITRTEDTPPGSIGQPFEGVAIYDRETRTERPRAVFDERGVVTNLDEAVGELVNTQGAGFFGGYYNNEQATADRLDGGMYWSGDLGYRDEAGFVYLAGRTSDWLRVDGENLAAAPIEAILLRHPAISQAAVYGVPDPDVGDQLMVALVLVDGGVLEPAGFEAFLGDQEDLSPKAWPRYVRIAEALPSTATNKVLKRTLIGEGTTVGADVLWLREPRGRSYSCG
ncbi:acyl-CoA synthetase [Nocardioides marmoriginsengisoli]|uniref:Acyl-CoA synthetase n=1 Tax=Nocardioides marmoriginsengisoli TaxID=661483 RepID=A0A3N0CHN3_9ACTN|nr:AMP-binding protein [Nocardioides marmoriginsengisoli]RNL62948.1 acyl-CoA synthetase [Nocardioides marmoriginsengisoli]